MPSRCKKPVGVFFFFESKDFSISRSNADRDALDEAAFDADSASGVLLLFALRFNSSISSRLSASSFLVAPSLTSSFFLVCLASSPPALGLLTDEGRDMPPPPPGDGTLHADCEGGCCLLPVPVPVPASSSSEQSHDEEEDDDTDDDHMPVGGASRSLARVIHFSTAERDAASGSLL
jgi:hypothetical protein